MRTLRTLLALSMAFLPLGCDRTAKNKIINGTSADGVAVEAAGVQALEDVWAMAKQGSVLGSVGYALGAPQAAAAPSASGVTAEEVCRSALTTAGWSSSPGTDGLYTIRLSRVASGLSGSFKIGFLNAAGGAVDICTGAGSVTGTRVKFDGFAGFGNSISLDLTLQGLTTPTLNGTVRGSAAGQLYMMQFTNCVYGSFGAAAPTSGTWTGSFGSTGTGVAQFRITFSAAGGSGTMTCGTGRLYRITITTGGVVTIKSS